MTGDQVAGAWPVATGNEVYAEEVKDDQGPPPAKTPLVTGFEVRLDRASGLRAADRNGLSDPYVVFRHGRITKQKSSVREKTLEPDWGGERFFVPVPEHTSLPLVVEVWDKDLFMDDFLGYAEISLGNKFYERAPGEFETMEVNLLARPPKRDTRRSRILGLFTAGPTARGDTEGKGAGQLVFGLARGARAREELTRRDRRNEWVRAGRRRTVVVELVRGHDLLGKDDDGYSDPYVSLTLHGQTVSSRVVSQSLFPTWKQRFEFNVSAENYHPDDELQLRVRDRDMFSTDDEMGEGRLATGALPPNLVHDLWVPLRLDGEPAGQLNVCVTVFRDEDTILSADERRSHGIGTLKLHIVQAKNLSMADVTGYADPFVEISLSNTRIRTHVEHRTLNPTWDRLFELPVSDVFSHVELRVFDYDRMSRPDFLGAVRIPLLAFAQDSKDQGQMLWYPLKTRSLLRRGHGEIRVAGDLCFNRFHGAARLITARSRNPMRRTPPFSPRNLLDAVLRLLPFIMFMLRVLIILNRLVGWRYRKRDSVLAMGVWTAVCLLFRAWMVPLTLLGMIALYNILDLDAAQTSVDEHGFVKSAHGTAAETEDIIRGTMKDFGLENEVEVDLNAACEAAAQEEVPEVRAEDEAYDNDDDDDHHYDRARGTGPRGDSRADASSGSPPRAGGADGRRGIAPVTALVSVVKRHVHRLHDIVDDTFLGEGEILLKQSLLGQFRVLLRIGKRVQEVLLVCASLLERACNIANFSVPLLSQTVVVLLVLATLVLLVLPWNIFALVLGYIRFAEEYYYRFLCAAQRGGSPPYVVIPYFRTLEVLMRAPSNVDKAQLRRLQPEDLAAEASPKIRACAQRSG